MSIRWDLDLSPLIGKKVSVTTIDQVIRTATLTDVKFFEIVIDDYICPVPKRLIFENDPSDWIELANVERIDCV